MYPSKGSSSYGQQLYNTQQGYGQISGTSFSGTPVGGSDVAGQHSLTSHQQSLLVTPQEADISSYRTHSSQASQYGGQYAAVYASSAMGTAQQAGGFSAKVPGSSSLQGRTTYASALAESSKFSAGGLSSSLGINNDSYVPTSSLGYTQKGDQYPSVKGSDYSSMDRRSYIDHQGAYIGRDLQNDPSRRFSDTLSNSHLTKSETHDHVDQASVIRQQQTLNAQSLQAGPDMRQADYFAATTGPVRHGLQEFSSYGGRMDVNPRSSSILGGTPYVGQHPSSILGGAPRRNVDEHIYPQGSSSAGYGVALPPGRDYATGKGLHGLSVEPDYQGSVFSRGHSSIGASMIDERKDDRIAFRRELEIRDEERHRELMRERERERDREREREREKERERIRMLEHRERERERERGRERDRLLKRREKERERARKREADARRARTPPKAAREHRASSSVGNERSLQRVTPRRETLHRHGSPVKEKRREYVCKVQPFCLVDADRDYLSLSKRYPRLSISPEFSKVVLKWPKEKLNISLYTPVSFEHDFVEVDNRVAEKEIPSVDDLSKSECRNITWNAKVILMSGISSGALEGLCSEKCPVDRVIHLKNILKFGLLKKDQSFMAIGGPWSAAIDGGDPSVDESTLIQTAIRWVKEIAGLDLHDCLHWNRFLEIHYHRVGKDGFFSHKEITVLFIPNLSNCLPSVDLWRSQWLAYKRNAVEREQSSSLKQKSSKENIEVDQKANKSGKDDIPAKKVKTEDTLGKSDGKRDLEGQALDKTSDLKTAEKKGKSPVLDEKQIEEKDLGIEVGDGKNNVSQPQDGALTTSVTDVQKPVKKKIIRKILKGKAIGKKSTVEEMVTQHDEKMDVMDELEKKDNQGTAIQENDISVDKVNVKTIVRKKTVKNDPVTKSPQKDDMVVENSTVKTGIKADIESELQDDKAMDQKLDGSAAPQEPMVKMAGKKKVIRRVVKRKVAKKDVKDGNATSNAVGKDGNMTVQKVIEGDELKDRVENKDEDLVENKSENEIREASNMLTIEKHKASEAKEKSEKEDRKESMLVDKHPKAGKKDSNGSSNSKHTEGKDSKRDGQNNNKKGGKEKRNSDQKHDAKQKTSKEMEKKSEEPPKHPGLFLRMKRTKGSKLRSVSLTLDGLLQYNEKDTQESTFELSLFAESLNEMLQYEMGSRLLDFLEKLRKKFVIKINQRKRERDEKTENRSEKEKSSLKRLKIDEESPQENESHKSRMQDAPDLNPDEKLGDDATAVSADESKMENEIDGDGDADADDDDFEYEEPEEFIEDEQVDDADNISRENIGQDEKSDLEVKPEKMADKDDTNKKTEDGKSSGSTAKKDDKISSLKEDKDVGAKNKLDAEKHELVDKEMLQAFRFFDQNQMGYIKVEDLRCILHSLGKFLTHKDVKELVHSALVESNPSARDNRIIYQKLLRLKDI
ncbi:hypothetical protein J5N97_014085 [Dioscorea zingiberensis]|uniref:EF-hand domain-containing protein n=1 Tax=Dioscorea zingiberensis TaxID=325984 RepID=A0A9D5CRY9_9LILI|nr:hypothetical protein J5N97_014085 [Dioscorea zingiberensis]